LNQSHGPESGSGSHSAAVPRSKGSGADYPPRRIDCLASDGHPCPPMAGPGTITARRTEIGEDALHRTTKHAMKCRFFIGLFAFAAMLAVDQYAFGQQAGTPGNFSGEKTSWHGFARFDFLMDEAALTVRSIKASPDEKHGIIDQVKGQLRCV